MKFNEKIAISAPKVLLVPYDAHHVPRYHAWMQDPAIQEATASEPLTLEEEYENQQSWRTSTDKLTFIVCKPLIASENAPEDDNSQAVVAGQADAPDRMVGDINLFLTPWEDDFAEDDDADPKEEQAGEGKQYVVGEVDIMIADLTHRGKGMGKAAVSTFLLFIWKNLRGILDAYAKDIGASVELKEIMVKIKATNAESIALFKGLGFEQKGDANYFGELEMRFKSLESIGGMAGTGYREVAYDRSKLKV